jgi:hypothetical protein
MKPGTLSFVGLTLATFASCGSLRERPLSGSDGGSDHRSTSDGETDVPQTDATAELPTDAGVDVTCSADASEDPENCGRCGHSCLGGSCSSGICQTFVVADQLFGVPIALKISGTAMVWEESDSFQGYLINLTRPFGIPTPIISLQGVGFDLYGSVMVHRFASSSTSFYKCSLSDACGADQVFSPSVNGGSFVIDGAHNRLLWVNVAGSGDSGTDVELTPLTTWISEPLNSSLGPIPYPTSSFAGIWNGYLYGFGRASTDTVSKIWRVDLSSTSPVPETLATSFAFNPRRMVAVGSQLLVLASDPSMPGSANNQMFTIPLPNGVGGAAAATYFSPVRTTTFVADDSYVYWGEQAGGIVYRCPVAGCTSPEVIATGQILNADAIAQDSVALYWGNALHQNANQIVGLAK